MSKHQAFQGVRVGSEAVSTRSEPLSAVYASMSEQEFQKHVVKALRDRQWRCFVVPDMRKTEAGLPDVIALHADWDFMLALELKREKGGKVSTEQRDVLAIMHRIPGVYAQVVRPSMWPALLDWIDSVTMEHVDPSPEAGSAGEGE